MDTMKYINIKIVTSIAGSAPAQHQAHKWWNHGFYIPSKRTEARRETNSFIVWLTPREGTAELGAPGAPFSYAETERSRTWVTF